MENKVVQDYKEFFAYCDKVYKALDDEWSKDEVKLRKINETMKNALRGETSGENSLKGEIAGYCKWDVEKNGTDLGSIEVPGYYLDLIDGIYHENWGFAGFREWFLPDYAEGSSAKIIGENIYFFVDGRLELMPQKLSADRRKQLVAKLLSIKPDERKDKDTNEIFLIDGTRVTIYNPSITKHGQDAVVFRRYIIPKYTFEEQEMRKTIPKGSSELFRKWVGLGYNVAMTGSVRTSKSTFLTTWQACEDKTLEGVMVETNPEIPMHAIMPGAPILQIVADDNQLKPVVKSLLRSDADYMIMGEARDGLELDTVVRIANKGTRRCKMTFHNRDPREFVYDVASEIVRTEGGNVGLIAEKVAASFNFVFHFRQLPNKSQKRLDGIFELSINSTTGDITCNQICKYEGEFEVERHGKKIFEPRWSWNTQLSERTKVEGEFEDAKLYKEFESMLSSFEYGEDGMAMKDNPPVFYRSVVKNYRQKPRED